MAKKAAAGGTPATAALTRARIPFTVHTYEHDPTASSFGLEAASALGLDPERVLKTLLAAVGGKKAVMADPHDAERVTGYVVGGISPIGQKKALPTVLDSSAMQHETVFVSGGRRGMDLEVTPADLVAVTRATLAAIRR
jgi:Cys-tRNA(Pro)/Cys-tRNA(Cys) deacylase